MKPDAQALTLEELCARTDFTERTVRYYIQRGLLPSPGAGRGSRYGMGHLYRLLLIKRMQAQHFPLAQIEKQLAAMSEQELAEAGVELRESRSSASEYIDSVLSRTSTSIEAKTGGEAGIAETTAAGAPVSEASWARWDRMPLSEDIELHVRRPLSRDTNRKIERIVAAARRILDEE